jgi:phenylacetate-CoA ligase
MSFFHTHMLLPFVERERHAGLARRMREIRRFERMSEKDQRAIQQQRLQRILTHAYNTVPFYRQRFDDAGFRPSDARVDRPLPLPALRRDDLRHRTDQLLSSAFPQSELRTSVTGGTTSTPVHFHRDIEALRNKTALQLQLNSWTGFHEGDSVLMLWGAHRDLAMKPSWRWRFYEETLLRRIPAPSGFISEEILERFRLRYEQHRPKVIYAYTNVLAAFAAYLKEHGLRHRPQTMIVTAELLTTPNRALIESVFDRPVFDHYGSRDIGMIASECDHHQGLHFHPWCSYVEFEPIGKTPDGPAYRLLVTDLLNYGQPFIRYDTGDCVVLAEHSCHCGRWFPLIKRVLGRVTDGFILPDGGIVSGTAIATQMAMVGETFRAISQVQFVQRSPLDVHLRYVVTPESGSSSQELHSICNGIDALAKQPMRWTLEQVADIPRESSGKSRLCVSEVSLPDSGLTNTSPTPTQPELVTHT